MEYRMLVVTCPSAKTAESIAQHLVRERLAACGNVTTPVTSIFRWRGRVRREAEVLLFVKTRQTLVPACVRAVRSRHPYELPEVIALPISGGLPEYLSWVGQETRGARPRSRGAAPSRGK